MTAGLAVIGSAHAGTPASLWRTPTTVPAGTTVQAGSAPIDEALSTIIPPPYKIVLDKAIPKSAVLVWPSGKNWMKVLKQAVAPLGLKVAADWSDNTIRVMRPIPLDVAPAGASGAPSPFALPTPGAGGAYSAARSATAHRTMPAPGQPLPAPKLTTPVPPLSVLLHTKTPAPSQTPSLDGHVLSGLTPASLPEYTLPRGTHLSAALAKYVKRYGWQLRWDLTSDLLLNAPFPVPSGSLAHGIKYLVNAYRAQGALGNAEIVFHRPNKIVEFEPAQAQESAQ